MSGYDEFFKKAKVANKTNVKNRKRVKVQASENKSSSGKKRTKKSAAQRPSAEDQLRKMLVQRKKEGHKSKNKVNPPHTLISLCVFGMIITAMGMLYPEMILQTLDKYEISLFGKSIAKVSEPKAKSTPSKADTKEKSAQASPDQPTGEAADKKDAVNEDMSYFDKLNDRKNELDQREQGLIKLEEELHKQKVEIEKRIVELENIRDQISATLKEKVNVDQEKVIKLVDFYSNMKPQQAAKIMGDIDEDLAVEILGQMKKKNAAAIMNLLEPKKAQNLSEKFAGYRRK